MNPLELKVKELEDRLTKYEQSGFWSRRDVVKGLGGMLGLGALAVSASAGSFLADMNTSNPQVKINDIALVKTTAGQTINVSTAAELTAALVALAAAPSLLGNVIIQLAAGTYTGNFVIPGLLLNGFTLTIQGTLTEILSAVATGGASPGGADVWTTNIPGYAEKTAAGWTVNAYKNMILMNPTGDYTAIMSNTATQIKYSCHSVYFPIFTNGQTITVYDPQTKITASTGNTIETNEASVIFKNLWIDSTATDGCAIKSAKEGFCDIYCCKITGVWTGGTVRLESHSIYKLYACIVFGKPAVRVETFSLMYNVVMPDITMHGGSNLIAVAGAARVIFCNVNGQYHDTFGGYIDGLSIAVIEGNRVHSQSLENINHVFIWNCAGVGANATGASHITGVTTAGFQNNGTNYTPAAASDPSYIA